jgi:hypothetical protein
VQEHSDHVLVGVYETQTAMALQCSTRASLDPLPIPQSGSRHTLSTSPFAVGVVCASRQAKAQARCKSHVVGPSFTLTLTSPPCDIRLPRISPPLCTYSRCSLFLCRPVCLVCLFHVLALCHCCVGATNAVTRLQRRHSTNHSPACPRTRVC